MQAASRVAATGKPIRRDPMAMHYPTNSRIRQGWTLALRALSLGRDFLLGLGGEQDHADLGALSDHQLNNLIGRLTERERTVSYERRMLHAKIDLLRAEQVTRLRQR